MFRMFRKRRQTPHRTINENENAKALHLHREFNRTEEDEIQMPSGESFRRLPNGTIVGFSENEFGERSYHTAYQRDKKGNFAKESLRAQNFNPDMMLGMTFNPNYPKRQVQKMENFNKVYLPARHSRIPFRSRDSKVVFRRKFPPFVPMREKTAKGLLQREQEDQLSNLDKRYGFMRRRDYHPNFDIDERIETIRDAQGRNPFKKMKAFVANRTKPVAAFDLETYDRFQTEAGKQHVKSSKETSKELDDGKSHEENFGKEKSKSLLSKAGIAATLAKGTQATTRMFKNLTTSLNKVAGVEADGEKVLAKGDEKSPEEVKAEDVSKEEIDQAKELAGTPKEKNQDPKNGISQEIYSQAPDHEDLNKNVVIDLRDAFEARSKGATNEEALLEHYAKTGANHHIEQTPEADTGGLELTDAELQELFEDVNAEMTARAKASKEATREASQELGPDMA